LSNIELSSEAKGDIHTDKHNRKKRERGKNEKKDRCGHNYDT